MKIKRICKTCGTEFYVYPSTIKEGKGQFCSRKCFSNFRITKVKRICKECGKEFETTIYKIKEQKGKFCSRKCWGKWKSKYIRNEKASNWRGGKIKRICGICGKEFEITTYKTKIGVGKYCSRQCHNKSQVNKIKQICKQCGKEFEIIPSKIKKGNGVFCSKKCSHIAKLGKNNPNWKGGISFDPYCYKFNKEFKEYIRNKFGHVCFLCQKTEMENGQHLSIHHVNYDKNCGCDDNLTCQYVPLCRSCNSKVNHNREMWETKIKATMRNKLNGWYI